MYILAQNRETLAALGMLTIDNTFDFADTFIVVNFGPDGKKCFLGTYKTKEAASKEIEGVYFALTHDAKVYKMTEVAENA